MVFGGSVRTTPHPSPLPRREREPTKVFLELHRPEISSRTLDLKTMEIDSLSPSPLWGEGWGEGWLLRLERNLSAAFARNQALQLLRQEVRIEAKGIRVFQPIGLAPLPASRRRQAHQGNAAVTRRCQAHHCQ